jgi:transcriptional regulator with XRE-family HTH domain
MRSRRPTYPGYTAVARFLGIEGHPLVQWRARFRVTQVQLSQACQLSQSQVSKIERGQLFPLRESLERLRTYTGLPTDAFIRPQQFLEEHPDFLRDARAPEVRRRRA